METDELAQHLESLQREECYRVDAVLKESPYEVTQRVYFMGDNGAQSGPFIRKYIQRNVGLGSAYRRMFEAQRSGKRFKYLPDILECYERDDQMVVVMEFVHGNTLQETVYQNDPSLDLALQVFPRICDAVDELHGEFDPPIIHRDLKPSNIILTGASLALIDFGISREYHEGSETDTTHFGTREFAPPEQFGFGQTGVYSDVYSLGMVLYFCLTEQIPNAQARREGFRNARIPEFVRQVIARAVALDPAERYASASDLKDAFRDSVFAVQAATARNLPPTDGASAQPPRTRSRTSRGVAVAIACLLVAAILAFGVRGALTGNSGASSAASQAASTSAQQASTSNEDDSPATPTEAQLVADIQTPGEPKNGFDPATNFTVTSAGVDFQLPSYFKARTKVGDKGEQFYYAETGSSVAMVMFQEIVLSGTSRTDFEENKDDYLEGFIEGLMKSETAFQELVASTDYELAGQAARVVTFTGDVKGVPFTAKGAFFFDPDTSTVGNVMFGQTNNAQFDYSADFAKVLTSARPANR